MQAVPEEALTTGKEGMEHVSVNQWTEQIMGTSSITREILAVGFAFQSLGPVFRGNTIFKWNIDSLDVS